MDKSFHSTLYNGCNYLFKLIHVNKRDPRPLFEPILSKIPDVCIKDCARRMWMSLTITVTMGTMVSQITSLTNVYSTIYSDADQRKHQSSASLAFVRGIHRGSVNSPHKWPVTRKMFPVDDVIMTQDTRATPSECLRVKFLRQIHYLIDGWFK